MLDLYHYAFSTCSQKVRLVLAEKGLDFGSHEVDLMTGGQHDPDYVRLNPNHVVPTLVHDGVALIESTLINEYLDEVFPQTPLRPPDARGRHAVRLWTQRVDEKVHGATGVVTFAVGPRSILLQQPAEIREANINSIPDPAQREARRSVIEHGVEAPEFAGALRNIIDLLDQADAALARGDWLSGDSFGLADACVLPYVLRLDHLAMTPLLSAEARPFLARWFQRAQERPAFEIAVSRWAPEPVVGMLRENGKAVWPQVAAIAGCV
jgi:glutathione S-transferase